MNKELAFNEDRANEMLLELLAVFQKHKPTVGELVVVYGNLGYCLGSSIGGYAGKGPDLEELKKLYYANPERLDVALMVAGLTTTSWFDSYEEQQINKSNTEEKEENKGKKEE